MEHIRVVMISAPRDAAGKLARALVEERLAACVNVVPKMESYFWWDEAVQHDEEALLIAKTTQQCFDDLLVFVRENHPYDLPEVVALPLVDAFSDYVDWVKNETRQ
jgi:periplasmic divalent cation tolerance protein